VTFKLNKYEVYRIIWALRCVNELLEYKIGKGIHNNYTSRELDEVNDLIVKLDVVFPDEE
jgi:hypothetical protein